MDEGGDDEWAEQLQRTLYAAIDNRAAWAIETLVEAGADVSALFWDGYTPLMVACWHEKPYATVEALLEAGADVNGVSASGVTTLASICGTLWSEEHVDSIKCLLEYGADVHAPSAVPGDEANGHTTTALDVLIEGYEYYAAYGSQSVAQRLGTAIAMLVAAGDCRVDLIPSPCSGLEAALVPVWRQAVEGLPAAFRRLGRQAQERTRTALLALHRCSPELPLDQLQAIIQAALGVASKEDAQKALPGIFQRLEPAVQARVRAALLAMHRSCPTLPRDMRWAIMDAVLA